MRTHFMLPFYAVSVLLFTACPPWWDVPTTSSATPPPAGQAPRKYAFVFADRNDGWFGGEGMAVTTELRQKGWTTYLTGELAGQATAIQALTTLVSTLRVGDQLLVDIQTHGGDVYGRFQSDQGEQVLPFGFGAEHFAQNPGVTYPTQQQDLGAHVLPVYDPTADRWEDLTPALLAPALRIARDRQVNVTVIDHSCNGGASVRYFSREIPNMCVVSSAGAMGPALTGWPSISQVISEADNMEDLGRWISSQIYSEQHAQGSRLHQVGFRTACDQTMAVRDLLDASVYGYGTWWHWMRESASHVVREPYRYAVYNEVSDYGPAHHPQEEMVRGWVAWLQANTAQFAATSTLGHQSARQAVTARVNELVVAINAYRAANDALINTLQAQSITVRHAFGGSSLVTLDRFLYTIFVGSCACPQAMAGSSDGDENTRMDEFVLNHDCVGLGFESMNNSVTDAAPWLQPNNTTCSDPRAHADSIIARFPNVAAGYRALRDAEAAARAAGMAVSRALEVVERFCTSTVCSGKAL